MMYYNIQEAYKLLIDYEKEQNIHYENVLITRPDLIYYSKINFNVYSNTIIIPSGTGFNEDTGELNVGVVQPLFYKNPSLGTCIPTNLKFNDQLMLIKRKSLPDLSNLLESICNYISLRVPLTPESLLYYHFCVVEGLKTKLDDSIIYEIGRSDSLDTINITQIKQLECFDPNNKIISSKNRNNRILRKVKKLLKKLIIVLFAFIILYIFFNIWSKK